MRRNSFNRKLRRALAASLGAFAFASSASIINAAEADHEIRARIRFLNWLHFGPNGNVNNVNNNNVNNNNGVNPIWINTGKNQAQQALKEFLNREFTWANKKMTLTGRNLNNGNEITSNMYNADVNALAPALGIEANMGNDMRIIRAGIYLKPANNGQNNKVKMDILLIKRYTGVFGNGNYRVAVNQLAVTAQPQNGHLNWPQAIKHQGWGLVDDVDVNKAVLNWTRGNNVRDSYLQKHEGYDSATGNKKPPQQAQGQLQNGQGQGQGQPQNGQGLNPNLNNANNNANNNVQHQPVNNVPPPPNPPPQVPVVQVALKNNAHQGQDRDKELEKLAKEMAKKAREKKYQEEMQQEEDDFLNIGKLDDEELVARNAKDDEKKRKKEEGKQQYEEKKKRQKEYQEKMQQEEGDFLNIGILDDEELAARDAENDEKKRKKEEGKRQYLEEKRRKVEEEARRKVEEEARRKADEDARRKADEDARKLVTTASYSPPPAAPAYSPATSAAIVSLVAMTPLVSNIAPIANHTPMTIQTPVNQVNAGTPTVVTSNITTPVGPQAGTTNVGTQNVTAQGTATQQTQTNSNVNHGNVVTKGDSSKNSVSSAEKLTR